MMPKENLSEYYENRYLRLKSLKFLWKDSLGIIASLITIGAVLFKAFDLMNVADNAAVSAHLLLQFIIIISLSTYILVYLCRRLHRYAQAVYCFHEVTHSIRDSLGKILAGETVPDDECKIVCQDILTKLAECFSIITGKRCRACICLLDAEEGQSESEKDEDDPEIKVYTRDKYTTTVSPATREDCPKGRISQNTSFFNIFRVKAGCTRYFLSNDLIKLWRNREYDNYSFHREGGKKPKPKKIFSVEYGVEWTLPYKSVLVVPIRYKPLPKGATPVYIGFLCIDCGSKGVFNEQYDTHLAAAIADGLYSYIGVYNNVNIITEKS